MSSTVVNSNLILPTLPRPMPAAPVPRWLHWWALLTVLTALPMVLLGAEVTTKGVGMVDPTGFRAPWHLFTLPLRELGLGYLIEHSHRLFAYLVGFCSIVLAIGLYLGTRHPLLRWMGCLALLAVSLQGVLGIFRVNLNALLGPHLALVHGCFAQLTFAVLVSVAVMTSRSWLEAAPLSEAVSPALRRLSLAFVGLVYLQILFGAVIRHFQDRVAQRLHILLAFLVVAGLLLLVQKLRQAGTSLLPARRWARVLEVLVTLQVLLGVEAWLGRFGSGVPVELQQSTPGLDIVRSGHFLIGLLVFTTTVIVALLVNRSTVPADRAQEAA